MLLTWHLVHYHFCFGTLLPGGFCQHVKCSLYYLWSQNKSNFQLFILYFLNTKHAKRQIMRTHKRNNLYSIELYLVFCYLLSLFLCINFLRRGRFVSCENFCSVLLLIIKHPINFIDLLLLLSLTSNFTYFISRDIITFTP